MQSGNHSLADHFVSPHATSSWLMLSFMRQLMYLASASLPCCYYERFTPSSPPADTDSVKSRRPDFVQLSKWSLDSSSVIIGEAALYGRITTLASLGTVLAMLLRYCGWSHKRFKVTFEVHAWNTWIWSGTGLIRAIGSQLYKRTFEVLFLFYHHRLLSIFSFIT